MMTNEFNEREPCRVDSAEVGVDFSTVSPAERAARWAIWRVAGVGFARFAGLLHTVQDDLRGLFQADDITQRAVLERANFQQKILARLLECLQSVDPEDAYAREVAALGPNGQLLAIGDPRYPRQLLDLRYPPVFLYLRGNLSGLSFDDTVAVVGSRAVQCAQAGLTRRIAGDLAGEGVATVSGGALGVDAAAHLGCLDAGAPTIAVLAGGVDRPSPRRNAAIFERIVNQGALISEYPLGVKPRAYHFQRRNELIAALSRATVVVRAGLTSGTMLTARAAAEIGRPICAVPGDPDEPLAAGCNQLLVEGAACVRDARDILACVFGAAEDGTQLRLDSLRPKRSTRPRPRPPVARPPARRVVDLTVFSADAQALFKALDALAGKAGADVGRDELKRHIDWAESRLCPAMLELELGGAIHKKAGANRFRPA